MRDQDMANDMLASLEQNGAVMLLACYRTSNQVFRQTLIQWVDNNEKSHLQLLQLVEKKGWYLPPPKASTVDIDFVRQFYAEPVNSTSN